jgi:hypothetical protein
VTVDAAVAAVRASDPAGLLPLLVLKEGFVPDKGDFLEGLEEDLEAVADGVTPGWMPAELADVLRSHPGYRTVLAAAPSR